jgi:hypothetical protein
MSVTNRTRLKIWFLLVVVFGLGYVTGVAVIELYDSRASGDRPDARAMHEGFENMRRELNLTDQQTTGVENHMHAVALHYMHYNFVRIHKSLRMTPAMAARVTEHLWEIEDIVKASR